MSGHTKGPWLASSNSAGDDGYSVAYPYTDIHPLICWGIRNDLDARLIAAAPEMLEALEANHKILFMLWEIESNFTRRDILADQLDINSTLIAKAMGKQS